MKKIKLLLIGFFLVFLLSGAIQYLHPVIKTAPVSESRLMAPRPHGKFLRELSKGAGYAPSVEAYFQDRFPLRDFLLRCLGQFEYSILGRAREVIVGHDGWLSDKKVITETQYQLDHVDEARIQTAILQIKRLQYWLQRRGVDFLVVVVPMKPTIYPEKYPSWYVQRPARTGMDRFYDAMKRNDIPALDVKKLLLQHKDDAQLYYKTDMHWDSDGAIYVAEAIVDYFAQKDLGRKIWHETLTSNEVTAAGGELTTMPLLFSTPERFLLKRTTNQGHTDRTEGEVLTFTGTDEKRALLPPSIMFGNSFTMLYPILGYHAYFKESSRVLDYKNFSHVLDYVKPEHKIFVLHIYENQLLFHLMETDPLDPSASHAPYWDPRIKSLPLPENFSYK